MIGLGGAGMAGERRGDRPAITPGAWAPELLSELGVPFRVLRQSLF